MLWSGWGDPGQGRRPARTAPQAAPGHAGRTRPGDPGRELRRGAAGPRGALTARPRRAARRRRRRPRALRRRRPHPAHPGQVHPRPDAHARRETAPTRPTPWCCPAPTPTCWSCCRLCAAHRVAVVPFGGGTSVVGGLVATRRGFAGVVALDLARLNRLISVDTESMVAEMEPGLRAPQAEQLLAGHGLTLGHFPQSYEYATLGGFAAARSSGQASAGYGRFDDMVVGMTVATPRGTLDLGRAPKSAAGPDLRQVILGSEGAFGVITSLRLRVRRAPTRRIYEGWRFDSFAAGSAALRRLAQEGRRAHRAAAVRRDRDDDRPGQPGRARRPAADAGCLAIAGYEGFEEVTAAARSGSPPCCPSSAASTSAPSPASRWRARAATPRPTCATPCSPRAPPWRRWRRRGSGPTCPGSTTPYGSRCRPRSARPLVMCHISHVYGTGASLYFTVVTAQSDDPLAQWEAAKRAVNEAIVAAGGTDLAPPRRRPRPPGRLRHRDRRPGRGDPARDQGPARPARASSTPAS